MYWRTDIETIIADASSDLRDAIKCGAYPIRTDVTDITSNTQSYASELTTRLLASRGRDFSLRSGEDRRVVRSDYDQGERP
jgi:hypothetical protein